MALDAVRIERIKLKDLDRLAIESVRGALAGDFIPITIHRARAMQQNPNAQPDDVALLLAKEGERNVGFFGVMPVVLRHEGQLHKVYWLTTWGVAPQYLGKGLGSRLMEEALALDVDLAIVGSKPARRVSTKYGFSEARPLDYVRIDFGLAGRYNPINLLLRGLRKLFSLVRIRLPIKGVEDVVGRALDAVFSPLFRPLLYRRVEGKLGKETNAVRVTLAEKVRSLGGAAYSLTSFYRNEAVVNWMLAHPWVLAEGSPSAMMNYGFTDERKGFQMLAWQLAAADGSDLGYITFQFSVIARRKVLKVLDYEFGPSAPAGLLLALAMRQARRLRADVIDGPAELAEPLAGSLLVLRKQRTLQVHPRAAESPLGRAWQHLQQGYTDGDTAFT